MNQKASELGLTSTHFVTPHGLDEDEHYTTAYELAKIADYALQNETFSKIVKTSTFTISISGNFKTLHNTNELLGFTDGVYGVKTGFTNGANRCLVSSCKRGNLDIICVVLGCDTKKNRTLDSIKLINYAFNNFTVINIENIVDSNFENWLKQNSNSFNIYKGTSSYLNLYLNKEQLPFKQIALSDSSLNNINISFNYVKDFQSPLPENTIIGNLHVNINDEVSFNIEILNSNYIGKKNVYFYIKDFALNYINYFLP